MLDSHAAGAKAAVAGTAQRRKFEKSRCATARLANLAPLGSAVSYARSPLPHVEAGLKRQPARQ
jgi:hypothetical protein